MSKNNSGIAVIIDVYWALWAIRFIICTSVQSLQQSHEVNTIIPILEKFSYLLNVTQLVSGRVGTWIQVHVTSTCAPELRCVSDKEEWMTE